MSGRGCECAAHLSARGWRPQCARATVSPAVPVHGHLGHGLAAGSSLPVTGCGTPAVGAAHCLRDAVTRPSDAPSELGRAGTDTPVPTLGTAARAAMSPAGGPGPGAQHDIGGGHVAAVAGACALAPGGQGTRISGALRLDGLPGRGTLEQSQDPRQSLPASLTALLAPGRGCPESRRLQARGGGEGPRSHSSVCPALVGRPA